MVTDPQTHRQDRLQYTAPQLAIVYRVMLLLLVFRRQTRRVIAVFSLRPSSGSSRLAGPSTGQTAARAARRASSAVRHRASHITIDSLLHAESCNIRRQSISYDYDSTSIRLPCNCHSNAIRRRTAVERPSNGRLHGPIRPSLVYPVRQKPFLFSH